MWLPVILAFIFQDSEGMACDLTLKDLLVHDLGPWSFALFLAFKRRRPDPSVDPRRSKKLSLAPPLGAANRQVVRAKNTRKINWIYLDCASAVYAAPLSFKKATSAKKIHDVRSGIVIGRIKTGHLWALQNRPV